MSEIPEPPEEEFGRQLEAVIRSRSAPLRARYGKDLVDESGARLREKFFRFYVERQSVPERIAELVAPGLVYVSLLNEIRDELERRARRRNREPELEDNHVVEADGTAPDHIAKPSARSDRIIDVGSVNLMVQVLVDRSHRTPVPATHLTQRAAEAAMAYAGVSADTLTALAKRYDVSLAQLSRERNRIRLALITTAYAVEVLAGRPIAQSTAEEITEVLDALDAMVGQPRQLTSTEYKQLRLAAAALTCSDDGYYSVNAEALEELAADHTSRRPSQWNLRARTDFASVLVDFHTVEARVAATLQSTSADDLGYHCCLLGCVHHLRANQHQTLRPGHAE